MVKSSAYVSEVADSIFFVVYGLILLFFNIKAKISIAKINKYPDIGSPCLQPLCISKGVDIFLFIKAAILNLKLTLSKAFSKSISNIISGKLFSFALEKMS